MVLTTDKQNGLFEAIAFLRSKFQEDEWNAPPQPKHWGGANSILESGLRDPGHRIEVYRMLTGILPLTSSRELCAWTLVTIIQQMKEEESWEANEYGRRVISDAETYIESEPDAERREADYRTWHEAYLSRLRETNPASA